MVLSISLLTLSSFIISFSLVPLTISLARKYKLVDDIRSRPHPAHTHRGSIPRAGGIPIFIGIFLPILLFLKINPAITGISLGALILVLTGIWDDRRDRSPYIRFLFNCTAAFAVIIAGVQIPYITNPMGGILHFNFQISTINFAGMSFSITMAQILALIWIVWTTNIVGWSGGVDGQLPGYVAISAVVIGLLSLRYIADPNQYYVTALSFLTAGAFFGFLPWNFSPQKIMPGYGGKTLAGFMLSVLAILSYAKFGTALLVLAVPMTDAGFIIFKRIFTGTSPVKATSGHLHHHLLNLGWSKSKIAVFYWGISLIAGFLALILNPRQKLFAALLIIIIISMFILWINFFKKLPVKHTSENSEF
ncbi:hypothetical protein A3D05_05310 [Candidatus Gottesmanbacteria bacterium RIFCSPHIGHO2_02_FULL_40_24]|uniref:Undecaprenyl-phosphate alpha-N-acetylglucosaminyl 1-phosphate transferase n=1 Tax=Candidatus Gottesmanbacteria bacterium RIFCSPHIGHO2_01_FULL_40_15 TaxID=1798376 RepID=A0A1F5Z7H6_9BACT|nr:MAG: hypothetical protein A2777_01945 [Candidatus Gottesmanbacteria bacterium RIFCSPHIGHO2_01_FULL_40_15]OGG16449.1 MAG: hypothetical protein A3D05_05310 [Candidatus Gottesmanbacteria bacterium RIFCSPHIGHO2_02_FULL_40_24]OGG22730.1 MAG: hypothetical protein A3B48_02940 [Candidatus Gottesmanbacteria bacterium RIFCSPLOWO2_01_FULL_40_10]OGG25563.1 MAG: hypothetical protein A3E42_04460 [Candidatus Gottesmanbacteria bacterium RIFCSPHIGHO2_12_FULL_40_13]OGG32569.1 MAG: hypothetical protein A3I80_0